MNESISACTGHRTDILRPTQANHATVWVSIGRTPKRQEGVCVAAQHNLREKWEPSSRSPVRLANKPRFLVLDGPDDAKGVADLARERLEREGIKKVRRDAVRAIEIIVSLPSNHMIDETEFFRAAATWFAQRFGGASNLLSAVVHYDEGCDHMHALIQPIVDGHLKGSSLIGAGGKFQAHHVDFEHAIAKPRGLSVLLPGSVMGRSEVKVAAQRVFDRLAETNDSLLNSAVFRIVRGSIERQPVPFASQLGLDLSDLFRTPQVRSVSTAAL